MAQSAQNVECEGGHYRDNCQKADGGTCIRCASCADPSQKRVRCGGLRAGTCKDKAELVRMPASPVEDQDTSELAQSVRQASGLGAFSFFEVFGADKTQADFMCSAPCDGVSHDSIQCDGPFACNVTDVTAHVL
jgi:hypothetical protein